MSDLLIVQVLAWQGQLVVVDMWNYRIEVF